LRQLILMKKIILAVFCFSGFVSSAQNGFYLQPQIGFGTSYVDAHDNLKLGTYENEGKGSVSVYNVELGVGYRLNQLEISSGIYFLRSGYYEHTLSGYMFVIDTKTTQYYNSIALPLMAGYRFWLGKRFSITPGFGYEISYNYSDDKTIDRDGVVTKQTLTGAAFTSQYHKTSLWGILRLGLGYKLNTRMNIIAGGEFHDMLSSMLPGGYNPAAYQYVHIFSLNAGITWRLGKYSPAKQYEERNNKNFNR